MYLRSRAERVTVASVERLAEGVPPPQPSLEAGTPTYAETQETLEDAPLPIPQSLGHLRHGDLFRVGLRNYRADGIYVVDRTPGRESSAVPISDENGHGIIPIAITAWIEDPVAFYEGGVESCDLSVIELGAAHHGATLRALAGGRAVAPERKAFYIPGEDHPYLIEGPPGPDLAREHPLRVPLDAATPAEYLSSAVTLLIDPIMEECRQANRDAHEIQAAHYFLSLMQQPEGSRDTLLLCSRPRDVEGSTWAASTGLLRRVVLDPLAPSGVGSIVVQGSSTGELTFKPRVLTSKGPFGGVAVWCDPEERWMLDLSDLTRLPEYE